MGAITQKILANNTRLCYTYDNLSRVIEKIVKNSEGSVISTETFDYDAAGNIIGDTFETIFEYDTNNRLEMYNGFEVTYDMDGNMVSNSESVFDYDSSNRLVRMDGHFYTYNAEDVRIKCVCDDKETTYTYNTNCKLSQLLTKTTNGAVTKYVYGLGLIGEESSNTFRTYHFDFRGSTVAVTDASGTVTDTFAYDTYGKCITRTGTSDIIFGYNGRDGVVTDDNGLIYMRARYYSPAMKRFINADVIAGAISNAITLNRFAYANGNPVSNVDPFGLHPKDNEEEKKSWWDNVKSWINKQADTISDGWDKFKTWLKEQATTLGDFFSDTFGFSTSVGNEKTLDSAYYFFLSMEEGIGYSKDFGSEKPINFFASVGEKWWEFWEWSIGIDVNINGYGGGISIGGETSINVHTENISQEIGVNALGRISYKVACNAGDGYVYSKYSLNGPEIAVVAVGLYYAAPVVIPAVAFCYN